LEHFPCLESVCLEKKFVVFETNIDLKAHEAEEHLVGKKRGVPVQLDFHYARPQQERTERGGRQQRGNSSRRRQESAQLPVQGSRQLQEVADVSLASRTLHVPVGFGSALSSIEPSTSTSSGWCPPGLAKQSHIVTNEIKLDPELLQTIQKLVKSNVERFLSFKEAIFIYAQGSITSDELLNSIIDITKNSYSVPTKNIPAEVGKFWGRLSDYLHPILGEAGSSDMLRAWNDYKIKVIQDMIVKSF
jgi:hypothetical protein